MVQLYSCTPRFIVRSLRHRSFRRGSKRQMTAAGKPTCSARPSAQDRATWKVPKMIDQKVHRMATPPLDPGEGLERASHTDQARSDPPPRHCDPVMFNGPKHDKGCRRKVQYFRAERGRDWQAGGVFDRNVTPNKLPDNSCTTTMRILVICEHTVLLKYLIPDRVFM